MKSAFFTLAGTLCFAGWGLTPSVSSQVPILRWDNPNTSGEPSTFPFFFRQLSDVDGDGFPEILLPDRSGQPDTVLWVYSMAKSQVLFTIPTSSFTGLVSYEALISTGDLNGDGFRDSVLVLSDTFPMPPSPRRVIRSFSGLDGTVLWQVDETTLPDLGGVAPVGDVDGDGTEDIATRLFGGTVAHILSGVDGTPFLTLTSGDPFGIGELRPAGDIDRDGFNDVMDDNHPGSLEFFSGATGQVILGSPGGGGDGRSFSFAVGVGDVNGDGGDDWAEGWRGDSITHPQQCFTPLIRIFTGIPPVELDQIPGREVDDLLYEGPFFHFDFDGDGAQELLFRGTAGDPTSPCSTGGLFPMYVTLYSPSLGRNLRTWGQPAIGTRQAMSEDWNGDGLPDLLSLKSVGATGATLTLQAFSLGNHLSVQPSSVSQSSGGTLVFQINAGTRFGNRSAFLLPSDGKEWPFAWKIYSTAGGLNESVALPFAKSVLTRQAFKNRGSLPFSKLRIPLDAQGKGSLSVKIPAGALKASDVGGVLRFTALLDTAVPGKPEAATEAVTIQVLP